MKNLIAATVAGVLLVQSAEAADPLPEPIRACAGMRNDVERLACYDKAVAHIESGSAAPSAENMFGANTTLAPDPKSRHPTRTDELQQLSGTVVSLSRSEGGLITLTLDNEQVWRQTDSDAVLTIEPGDLVTISRASLGTFRLVDKRGRTSRFKRLR